MRRLDLLPHGPYLPTASELHRARECLAVWAYGLPESEGAPGEWAEMGRRLHVASEALVVGVDVLRDVVAEFALDEQPSAMARLTLVRDAVAEDRSLAKTFQWPDGKTLALRPELGIKWRSDGIADEAQQCKRAPGERLQGWFSGTADLVYVRHDGVLVVADWKFGPRAKYIDAKAKSHAQGWFLALAFSTLLEINGSSYSVVVARFEARYAGTDGIDVDGTDITWGEICEWRDVLANHRERLPDVIEEYEDDKGIMRTRRVPAWKTGLAWRIEHQENALPRITAACARCKAKAECSAQKDLETLVMAEVHGANIEALCRPPQSTEDVRALHFAIAQAEHLAAEWKKWRDSYVLAIGPVPLGMGIQLEAKPTSRRSVVDTSEAMDLIESVAGKAAIEVQRSATIDSIETALIPGANAEAERSTAHIASASDRKKAKAAARARHISEGFARLVEGGAVRETGKTYTVRECRAGETEE